MYVENVNLRMDKCVNCNKTYTKIILKCDLLTFCIYTAIRFECFIRGQASLNSSLNGKIIVVLVKRTIFEVILPHRMGLIAIGAIWAFLNKLRVLLLV